MLEPIERLAKAFARLPGVGRRSGERMALGLVRKGRQAAEEMVAALQEVERTVTQCAKCGNVTLKSEDPCRLCTDPRRDDDILCVVEDASDIGMIEDAGGYRGRYFALMGKISPRRGEAVDEARLEMLLRRIREEKPAEVILALNSDVESDATASFLQDVLATSGAKISRLAFGLPAGSGIAYADSLTLARAIEGRREM
jgi:recombination protein RecR